MGSGAYVCGEETALIESLEGQRGEPRNRPPFPIDTGYLGNPTIVNNVETFAWVVCILAKGADWFKSYGTEKSTGHKLFSVSGDCQRPGVYEFRMGITVAELLARGRAARTPRRCRSAAPPASACPAAQFRPHASPTRTSPPAARSSSSAPDATCSTWPRTSWSSSSTSRAASVRPAARARPSCSKASRCSSAGDCSMTYLEELCSLGETMQLASKCGLGQTAPNAFLSIVQNFRDEILGRDRGIELKTEPSDGSRKRSKDLP